MDRCGRCGWDSPVGTEYCRRCGQSLISATRVPAPTPVPQSVIAVLELVPPTVWRGAAALAAGAVIEVVRRLLLAQRPIRTMLALDGAERALTADPEIVRQVARDPNVEVTEVVIYRRISRRR